MARLTKLIKHITSGQNGYARSEILMATAVAVLLGAVVLPRIDVDQFQNPGIKTSKKTELEHVNTAMQAMMAGNAVTSIIPNDASNDAVAVKSWANRPTGGIDVISLGDYLASATTTYYYCYSSSGAITEQFDNPSSCIFP